ncbi:CHAT domain-containing protein [Streptomyces sp. NPDC052092]|uniref:CHAT domain-containing protein n=1 Tax=Streptomyces sp. NPDC052092 TaxID=3365685 RepID=UPI0037D687E9
MAGAEAIRQLAAEIINGQISEKTAVDRVRRPQLRLAKDQAQWLTSLASAMVMDGQPSIGYLIARLVVEASEVRWGRKRHSPWWRAADVLVEAARLDLISNPDVERLRFACAIADDQIAQLKRSGSLNELAETMYAAGILRLHPHIGRPIMHDDVATLYERTLRTVDRTRLLTGPDVSAPGAEELFPGAPPSPLQAAQEALPYLYGAVGLADGHLRARCLNAVNEALILLNEAPEESPWLLDAIRDNCRASADLLDQKLDPVNWIKTRRILAHFEERQPDPTSLDKLLPTPLAQMLRERGERETRAVLNQALALLKEAGAREELRVLLDSIGTHLPTPADPEFLREIWESHLHVLPGDDLPCPVAESEEERQAYTRAVDAVFSGMAHDPNRYLPGALHVTAHIYHTADLQSFVPMLDAAEDYAERQSPEILSAIWHLIANASAVAAGRYRTAGKRHDALTQFARSSSLYAQLGLLDLALHQLESLTDCCVEGEPRDAAYAAGLLRIYVVPFLRTAVFEQAAACLLTTSQRLAAVLATSPYSSPRALTMLETASKGYDFSRALAWRGTQTVDPDLADVLRRIGELERQLGGEELPRLEEIGEDMQMLCYAGTQEATPGDTPEGELSNLRRLFDRAFAQGVHNSRNSFELEAAPGADDIISALPDDTVLISLSIGLESGQTATDPDGPRSAALYVTTITREGYQDVRVRHFSGLPGGVVRIGTDGYSHAIHPFADPVEEVRAAVRIDPLFGEVAEEVAHLLNFDVFFGGLSDLLPKLYRDGKRHLCFWPQGPFHALPFHLLRIDGRPLAEQWTVTTVPSLVCVTGKRQTRTGQGLVSLGAAQGGTTWNLPEEPELDEHAQDVARSADGVALVGPDATPASLLQHAVGARYVHVAAHGSLSQEAPWLHCLYLNPPDKESDGRLFAYQVLGADLRQLQLVTLSACESGLGRFDPADNLRGLPSAFLMAGAQAVVGCLWPVRPAPATYFFSKLYEHLGTDEDTLAAFWHAQRQTRSQFPQYCDWGAFAYQGSWNRSPQRNPR